MAWEPNYATRDEFKVFARISDTDDDVAIDRALAMASRAVDKQCGRQFGKAAAPEAREYTARYSRARGGVWMIEMSDLQDTTGLAVAFDTAEDGSFSTTVSSAQYVLWPRNAIVRGRPYERIVFRATSTVDGRLFGVRVTGLPGWNAVPTAIAGATMLQISRMHARRDAPFGVAGSPDTGSELRLLAKLDPDVVVAVERYKRRAWFR